jgi:SAM-dependent methyltransferase
VKKLPIPAALRPPLQRARAVCRRLTASRAGGIRAELAFWERWLQTGGLQWPDEYRMRLDPGRPFPTALEPFLAHLPPGPARILDVGAGPLTSLGAAHPTRQILLTATDVLAPKYDALLARYGVTPPVRTVFAEAERLVERFGPDSFDLVHAQNSIDHARDPVAAILQMLAVARPGCFVVLGHEENEAENEGYAGLHQWNFTRSGDAFVITGRRTTDVSRLLAPHADVICDLQNGWLAVQIRKRAGAVAKD